MMQPYGPDSRRDRQTDGGAKKNRSGQRRRQEKFRKEEARIRHQNDKLYNYDEVADVIMKYEAIDASKITEFKDFPLSRDTLAGLGEEEFIVPTEIQRQCIGLALQGHDILGAAKTGSGKTLAFLIPVLECLFTKKWSWPDGIGALIISPVRELAYQTFEVLRKVGASHNLSAGLVIGGKRLKEEAAVIARMNILVCTPGRLLQHMDETPGFSTETIQILVLDEADRILDMGFAPTMNAIIDNLPSERQTLLFSATQTKSVKDLARLSLNKPMFISADELAEQKTPPRLQQNFLVCELDEKISILWSFIIGHPRTKIIVFLNTTKQVKFYQRVFAKLRCGLSMHALFGSMDQFRRVGMYDSFCEHDAAILFATDVAARGLDFPAVHWVIQMDCPEDTNTYIHRVGRTARYKENGQALLILLPSERDSMVAQLRKKNVPIEEIRANPKHVWNIQGKLDSLMASDKEIKQKAQAAFTTYLKSVYLMADKSVFNYSALDTDKYATSLGLAIVPRVRFVEKALKLQKKQKEASTSAVTGNKNKQGNDATVTDTVENKKKQPKDKPKIVSAFGTKNITRADDDNEIADDRLQNKDHDSEIESQDSDSDNNLRLDDKDKDGLNFNVDCELDDILKVKTRGKISDVDDEEEEEISVKKSKKKVKTLADKVKGIERRGLKVNKTIKFDDEGEVIYDRHKDRQSVHKTERVSGINVEEAKLLMKEQDVFDIQTERMRIKTKHKEAKRKLLEEKREAMREKLLGADAGFIVTLGDPNAPSDEEPEYSDHLPAAHSNKDSDNDEYSNLLGSGDDSDAVSDESDDDVDKNTTRDDGDDTSDDSTDGSSTLGNQDDEDEEASSPDSMSHGNVMIRSRGKRIADVNVAVNCEGLENMNKKVDDKNQIHRRPPAKKKWKLALEADDDFSDKLSMKDAERLAMDLLT